MDVELLSATFPTGRMAGIGHVVEGSKHQARGSHEPFLQTDAAKGIQKSRLFT